MCEQDSIKSWKRQAEDRSPQLMADKSLQYLVPIYFPASLTNRQSFFQVKMKTVASAACSSNIPQARFLPTTAVLWQAAEELHQHSHFVTQNIKKMYTQGLRVNKINNFYCFIKDILE